MNPTETEVVKELAPYLAKKESQAKGILIGLGGMLGLGVGLWLIFRKSGGETTESGWVELESIEPVPVQAREGTMTGWVALESVDLSLTATSGTMAGWSELESVSLDIFAIPGTQTGWIELESVESVAITAKSSITPAGWIELESLNVSINVNVPAIHPIADFQPSIDQGVAPQWISFTNNSLGTITSWDWNFGDGTHDTLNWHGLHYYANPGDYTVILTVYGPVGSSYMAKHVVLTAPSPYPAPNWATFPNDGNWYFWVIWTSNPGIGYWMDSYTISVLQEQGYIVANMEGPWVTPP
ncbi:MAG: PKD domain-containing protein [Dehalococcoidales bacterium]|nr:PKD domain-containing protein [Dehalococcoidales bacterium]